MTRSSDESTSSQQPDSEEPTQHGFQSHDSQQYESRLLSLPRELILTILEFATFHEGILRLGPLSLRFQEHPSIPTYRPILDILLVCKLLYRLGLEAFYGVNTFGGTELVEFAEALGPDRRALIRRAHLTTLPRDAGSFSLGLRARYDQLIPGIINNLDHFTFTWTRLRPGSFTLQRQGRHVGRPFAEVAWLLNLEFLQITMSIWQFATLYEDAAGYDGVRRQELDAFAAIMPLTGATLVGDISSP
ncbi:hypothetical protein AMS68_002450 [Peltaster fructicola]|uniref:Uncharacterized protein n=1 Tax=Peltaster fructicola TaxID=286661 RepID=A0A6H0XQE9_9PEZI|nr:hypothetical protein AMS68_002450 [Peltaster fructicola]